MSRDIKYIGYVELDITDTRWPPGLCRVVVAYPVLRTFREPFTRHSLGPLLRQNAAQSHRCPVIALWHGHESVETTQIYLHANLALKESILLFKSRQATLLQTG